MACESAACWQQEAARLQAEVMMLRAELAARSVGCNGGSDPLYPSLRPADAFGTTGLVTLRKPAAVHEEAWWWNASTSDEAARSAAGWHMSPEANTSRRLEEVKGSDWEGFGSLRRFSKRLGKRLGGRGGVHSTHGNCSFVKSPNTNLLELLAATPEQARLYSHGGRCAHRFSDVESALVACAAIPACGGVSRDNGLNCGPAGPRRFELRAGTAEPSSKNTVSFVCSQREKKRKQLRRKGAAMDQGVAFIMIGGCPDSSYSCNFVQAPG